MDGSRVLVTGGAGFLGSHFIRKALGAGAAKVVNVDLLTYAGDPRRLADVENDHKYGFVKGDVASPPDIRGIFDGARPDIVVHFAADSHVTRSETNPDRFFRTNVEGTRVLLDAAISAGVSKFVQISTDEVYGPALEGSFKEEDKEEGEGKATSAYARSKAVADDLARSYADNVSLCVVRPTNAFGPGQYPEKALARWITRGLSGDSLPVWGDGLYVRQWLYAEDLADAVALVVNEGEPGAVYNVGPDHTPEITNIALVRWLAGYLDLEQEAIELTAYDRPDHDRRYSVDPSRIRALGWSPGDVWAQMAATVEWYRGNKPWWEPLVEEAESIYTDVST